MLTAVIGVNGLVKRLALDRSLPAFLLETNSLRGTNHWIAVFRSVHQSFSDTEWGGWIACKRVFPVISSRHGAVCFRLHDAQVQAQRPQAQCEGHLDAGCLFLDLFEMHYFVDL